MTSEKVLEENYNTCIQCFKTALTRLLNSEDILIEQNIIEQTENTRYIQYVVGDAATNKCIYLVNYYQYLGSLKSYDCRLPDKSFAQLPTESMKRIIADSTHNTFIKKNFYGTKPEKPIIQDPTFLADQSLIQRIYNFSRTKEQKHIEDNIFTRVSEILKNSRFYFIPQKIGQETVAYAAKKKLLPVHDCTKDETLFEIQKIEYREFTYHNVSSYFYVMNFGNTKKQQPVSLYMTEKIYKTIDENYKPMTLCEELQEFHDFLNESMYGNQR